MWFVSQYWLIIFVFVLILISKLRLGTIIYHSIDFVLLQNSAHPPSGLGYFLGCGAGTSGWPEGKHHPVRFSEGGSEGDYQRLATILTEESIPLAKSFSVTESRPLVREEYLILGLAPPADPSVQFDNTLHLNNVREQEIRPEVSDNVDQDVQDLLENITGQTHHAVSQAER